MPTHWTNDYTGKTIEKPLRVKNLIALLNKCDGESTVGVKDDYEIIVTNKKGEVEIHMPLVENLLEMTNGDLDGPTNY